MRNVASPAPLYLQSSRRSTSLIIIIIIYRHGASSLHCCWPCDWTRDQCVTVAQLCLGHSPLFAAYLHRIRRRDSATCPHCNELRQCLFEVWHYLQQNVTDSAIDMELSWLLGEGGKTFSSEYTWYLYFSLILREYVPPLSPVSYTCGIGVQWDSVESNWGRACVHRDDILSTCYEPVVALIGEVGNERIFQWRIVWLMIVQAKNYRNRTLIVLFIVQNVVTCFFFCTVHIIQGGPIKMRPLYIFANIQ